MQSTFDTALGQVEFVPFEADQHLKTFYDWASRPYASFWGYNGMSVEQVDDEYRKLLAIPGYEIFMGQIDGQPQFMVEYYDPAEDAVGEFYQVRTGDRGMHVLLAPADHPKPGFSWAVFHTVMTHLFSSDDIQRIVVEPDATNHKIHRLNLRAGFTHVAEISLPHKQALLGFCTREQFNNACGRQPESLAQCWPAQLHRTPQLATDHLRPELWHKANRHLAAKLIREMIHELLVTPEGSPQHCQITNRAGDVSYQFSATVYMLDHWQVDGDSIRLRDSDEPVDVMRMILAFAEDLGIPPENMPTYLEEISATLCGLAWKYQHRNIPAAELAQADFQTMEACMTEGHPVFIANNGRIGFSAADFRAYAPESASPVRLLWVAARRDRSVFSCIEGLTEQALLAQEFDLSTLVHWRNLVKEKGQNPDDFVLVPVHPWQWHNKLYQAYAPDIAGGYLIFLGEGPDDFQAQQSIRTFFNRSVPTRSYVKTALSVLNMGFMRGLSADYMEVTPAINDWLSQLVANDGYLQQNGMALLREIAGTGYRSPYFSQKAFYDNPYRKMLAGLWRENPLNQVADNERVMTMAALLHRDPDGNSLAAELMHASGIGADAWLRSYLNAYMAPVVHCFYAHNLVYMPHGENVILVIRDNTPVRVIMKDLGEEICLLNIGEERTQALPEAVRRISISLPESMEVLSIFTDVFDGILRYLAPALIETGEISEQAFWQAVADVFIDYRRATASDAAIQQRIREHDPFVSEFANSCLNRLQLKNNKQMVDLADPGSSLQLIGTLPNPVAPFRPDDW